MAELDNYVWDDVMQGMSKNLKHNVAIKTRSDLIIYDQNNGQYQSQQEIDFDLSSASNLGTYIDFRAPGSYIEIPCATRVYHPKVDATLAGTYTSQFMTSLKNGSYCLIRSLNVSLGSDTVIVPTEHYASRISYELIKSSCVNDEMLLDTIDYVWEDGREYDAYRTAADSDGLGNSVVSVQDNLRTDTVSQPNVGRRERCLKLQRENTTLCSEATILANREHVRRNYSATHKLLSEGDAGNTTQGKTMVYVFIARIPLTVIHDYFRQVPLSRSAYYRIQVYVNAPVVVNATANNAAAPADNYSQAIKYTGVSVQMPWDDINPVQLGSLRTADALPNGAMTAGLDTVQAELTICDPLCGPKKCSIHLSMITLTEEYENMLLKNPVRPFKFDEHYVHHIKNVGAYGSGTESVNQLVNSNVSRIREIFILPYFAGEGSIPSALRSPWDSFGSGFLSSPQAIFGVSQLQCYISGEPVFSKAITTADEHYKNFLSCMRSGGYLGAKFNSGLINKAQFLSQYGAICIPIRRHAMEDIDGTSKSITLEFRNLSPRTMSYLVFIRYEKHLVMNVLDGMLVDPKKKM